MSLLKDNLESFATHVGEICKEIKESGGGIKEVPVATSSSIGGFLSDSTSGSELYNVYGYNQNSEVLFCTVDRAPDTILFYDPNTPGGFPVFGWSEKPNIVTNYITDSTNPDHFIYAPDTGDSTFTDWKYYTLIYNGLLSCQYSGWCDKVELLNDNYAGCYVVYNNNFEKIAIIKLKTDYATSINRAGYYSSNIPAWNDLLCIESNDDTVVPFEFVVKYNDNVQAIRLSSIDSMSWPSSLGGYVIYTGTEAFSTTISDYSTTGYCITTDGYSMDDGCVSPVSCIYENTAYLIIGYNSDYGIPIAIVDTKPDTTFSIDSATLLGWYNEPKILNNLNNSDASVLYNEDNKYYYVSPTSTASSAYSFCGINYITCGVSQVNDIKGCIVAGNSSGIIKLALVDSLPDGYDSKNGFWTWKTAPNILSSYESQVSVINLTDIDQTYACDYGTYTIYNGDASQITSISSIFSSNVAYYYSGYKIVFNDSESSDTTSSDSKYVTIETSSNKAYIPIITTILEEIESLKTRVTALEGK